MPDYEKMYFQLAARVADAIDMLVEAQQKGEDDYIEDNLPIVFSAYVKSKEKNEAKIYPTHNRRHN